MWFAALAVALVILLIYGMRRMGGEVDTPESQEVDVKDRVVVVTGCDSGIGLSLALHARSWGLTVVATVLQPEGETADRLREAGVVVVMVDLRHHHTFNALTTVLHHLHQQSGQELWCLVNNAGVLTFGQCEWQTAGQVWAQTQVNLTGAIQLTSTLLPFIRRHKGRVVNVCSPAGQVGTPNMTVYCATKGGLEAFTHALRRELAPVGVSVILVRPCNLPNRTGIMRNAGEQVGEMLEAATEETKKEFGEAMTRAQHNLGKVFAGVKDTEQDLGDDHLISCFRSALLSPTPQLTYSAAPLVVTAALNLLQCLPYAWVDILVAQGVYDKILRLARNT